MRLAPCVHTAAPHVPLRPRPRQLPVLPLLSAVAVRARCLLPRPARLKVSGFALKQIVPEKRSRRRISLIVCNYYIFLHNYTLYQILY